MNIYKASLEIIDTKANKRSTFTTSYNYTHYFCLFQVYGWMRSSIRRYFRYRRHLKIILIIHNLSKNQTIIKNIR